MMSQVGRVWRSFVVKIIALVVIFFVVPAIVYQELQAADAEKNRLLLESVEAQSRLIAEALRPQLEKIDGATMRIIAQTVQRLGAAGPNIKLLFRPASKAASPSPSFYYIASSSAVTAQYREQELQNLQQAGALDHLHDSCEEGYALVTRFTNPAGGEELLTSITPIKANSGCWAVITSSQTAEFLGSSLGIPYWQTPTVQLAAGIYLGMAVIVTILFIQAGLSLRRFGQMARNLRMGMEQRGSFSSLNRIPELTWVAEEFDNLVVTLRSSAQALRFAAEETAHAFKTPLSIIVQSLEPLRRSLPKDNPRAQRAMEIIDRSLDRLDGLVSAARRLDETIADTFNPTRERVSLSQLVEEIVGEYSEANDPRRVRFLTRIEPDLMAIGSTRLLETVLQNLLDNAVSFSREGGAIEVSLRAAGRVAELAIADQGPGVEPDKIGRIFERFVSMRPADTAPVRQDGEVITKAQSTHFGLGLWIVRRNVEAMGGVVAAENRREGGLRVIIALPRAN